MNTTEKEKPALRITARLLASKGACPDQVKLFRRTFPKGADVTVKNALKAVSAGLDLNWAACNLLSAPAWKAYLKATAPAWKAYKEATAPALEAYEEATATALEACKEATATDWKAYEEARAPAFVSAWLIDHPEVTR